MIEKHALNLYEGRHVGFHNLNRLVRQHFSLFPEPSSQMFSLFYDQNKTVHFLHPHDLGQPVCFCVVVFSPFSSSRLFAFLCLHMCCTGFVYTSSHTPGVPWESEARRFSFLRDVRFQGHKRPLFSSSARRGRESSTSASCINGSSIWQRYAEIRGQILYQLKIILDAAALGQNPTGNDKIKVPVMRSSGCFYILLVPSLFLRVICLMFSPVAKKFITFLVIGFWCIVFTEIMSASCPLSIMRLYFSCHGMHSIVLSLPD